MGCRQAVRHQTLTLALVGSNPAIPANTKGTRRGAFCVGWDGMLCRAFAVRKCVGAHSPPEDRQARLSGAGCGNHGAKRSYRPAKSSAFFNEARYAHEAGLRANGMKAFTQCAEIRNAHSKKQLTYL